MGTLNVLSRGRIKAALQYETTDVFGTVEVNDLTIFLTFRSNFNLQQASKICGFSKITCIEVKEEAGAWTSSDALVRRKLS